MALLAGIDEAGYGPTLGPLVVTGVVFDLPDKHLHDCLWKVLRATCTARPDRSGRRLVVADSKQVYRGQGCLSPLERVVLVTLAAAGQRPKSWRGLLDILAPNAVTQLASYPWYQDFDTPIPVSEATGDVGTRANAMQRDWARSGVKLRAVISEPLPAGRFNDLVRRTRNKAVVLLDQVTKVIDRVINMSSDAGVIRIQVDRLGGRTCYRDALMTALAPEAFQVIEESANRSAYRLTRAKQTCDIEFAVDGDASHFPVALASMFSKYQRELYMRALNHYWTARMPELRPTAGYYHDARRWLRDVSAEVPRVAIDRRMLVRER